MSMTYWGIVGYGVCLDDLDPHLNNEKVNKLIREMNPDIVFEGDVLSNDTFYGEAYDSFAEFLCDINEEEIFTWADDGQGTYYFMYTAPMPWEMKLTEPKSLKEMKQRMADVLQKVYDIPFNTLIENITYIDTYGGC